MINENSEFYKLICNIKDEMKFIQKSLYTLRKGDENR